MSRELSLTETLNSERWNSVPQYIFKLIDENKDNPKQLDELLETFNTLSHGLILELKMVHLGGSKTVTTTNIAICYKTLGNIMIKIQAFPDKEYFEPILEKYRVHRQELIDKTIQILLELTNCLIMKGRQHNIDLMDKLLATWYRGTGLFMNNAEMKAIYDRLILANGPIVKNVMLESVLYKAGIIELEQKENVFVVNRFFVHKCLEKNLSVCLKFKMNVGIEFYDGDEEAVKICVREILQSNLLWKTIKDTEFIYQFKNLVG
jgi:hypothetical protein